MGIYLTKPNTVKESINGECDQVKFGASSMQGWRTSMEDAHICETNLKEGVNLFAVFDGHGGPEVARFCSQNFCDHLKINKNFIEGKYKEALEETFLRMDELLVQPNSQEQLKQFKKDSDQGTQSFAGCTANVCIMTKTEIYCANAGDSRALLYSNEGILPLSKDHKPDLEIEKTRITTAGGYVSDGRVNENLNLSRAIGDLEYKKNPALPPEEQIITAFPDVMCVPLDKKYIFLLMGCDGIWETLSTKEICEKINARLNSKDVKVSDIIEETLDRLIAKDTMEAVGCDNMTSVLAIFK